MPQKQFFVITLLIFAFFTPFVLGGDSVVWAQARPCNHCCANSNGDATGICKTNANDCSGKQFVANTTCDNNEGCSHCSTTTPGKCVVGAPKDNEVGCDITKNKDGGINDACNKYCCTAGECKLGCPAENPQTCNPSNPLDNFCGHCTVDDNDEGVCESGKPATGQVGCSSVAENKNECKPCNDDTNCGNEGKPEYTCEDKILKIEVPKCQNHICRTFTKEIDCTYNPPFPYYELKCVGSQIWVSHPNGNCQTGFYKCIDDSGYTITDLFLNCPYNSVCATYGTALNPNIGMRVEQGGCGKVYGLCNIKTYMDPNCRSQGSGGGSSGTVTDMECMPGSAKLCICSEETIICDETGHWPSECSQHTECTDGECACAEGSGLDECADPFEECGTECSPGDVSFCDNCDTAQTYCCPTRVCDNTGHWSDTCGSQHTTCNAEGKCECVYGSEPDECLNDGQCECAEGSTANCGDGCQIKYCENGIWGGCVDNPDKRYECTDGEKCECLDCDSETDNCTVDLCQDDGDCETSCAEGEHLGYENCQCQCVTDTMPNQSDECSLGETNCQAACIDNTCVFSEESGDPCDNVGEFCCPFELFRACDPLRGLCNQCFSDISDNECNEDGDCPCEEGSTNESSDGCDIRYCVDGMWSDWHDNPDSKRQCDSTTETCECIDCDYGESCGVYQDLCSNDEECESDCTPGEQSDPTISNLQVIPTLCSNLATFGWKYNDDDCEPQSIFQLQIDDDEDFESPEVDRTASQTIIDGHIEYQQVLVKVNNALDSIMFGKEYYWRVKVWDINGNESLWTYYNGDEDNRVGDSYYADGTINASSKTTYLYPYDLPAPLPYFTADKVAAQKNEKITFTDQSICYELGGGINGNCTYLWDFGDGTTSAEEGDKEKQYANNGTYYVKLKICYTENYCCETDPFRISIGIPSVPIWKEVSPF